MAYFNLPQSHSLAIPLLDIYPKNAKTATQTDNCILMFTEALFKTAKSSKKPKCTSTDEWITKCGIIGKLPFTFVGSVAGPKN